MSRRSRKRPYGQPHPDLDIEGVLRGGARRESAPDGQWSVRQVRSGEKAYACPGCGQDIPPGTWHAVAFREDHMFGAEAGLAERRHWHEGCWRARGRRR